MTNRKTYKKGGKRGGKCPCNNGGKKGSKRYKGGEPEEKPGMFGWLFGKKKTEPAPASASASASASAPAPASASASAPAPAPATQGGSRKRRRRSCKK